MSAELSWKAVPLEVRSIRVPWSAGDSWLGLGLLVFLLIGALAATVIAQFSNVLGVLLAPFSDYLQIAAATALELVFVLPVGIILAWRHANWRNLGFRAFPIRVLGLGCALLLVTYVALIVYDAVIVSLKLETQGDALMRLLSASKWPMGYVIPIAITAPFVEEMFFRGFLFQGLRQKHGWKIAALMSSSVFALMHVQGTAMVPTFLLGYLICFVYNRANSIWPGIILHALINSLALFLGISALPFSHV